ncbi:sex-determining protein, putative [Trichomonas vaginalis G3]|uniref:Sex-determining protein, putative n=1 Tax=Trichomonas vaginalis (strain ATCC PRA-98 / G3) TaxID=412133 RepID=A2FJC8_TRIV3|nr:protein ubiquitination [Trichomonas vaginalis G3]EAX94989.1 sex-determining protein, putative [Trichomonas vaginalis G3]KAI5497039.1 protein ubiquitination [Trichomonas vaginalis G3]|eukprot:XP_001307919.1 sex-determining protein [Trichomonas vaginalis G3]
MCLEQQDPDEECLKYAIISHNIDFVTYLMDEYQIDEMNLSDCLDYNNIQAFFYYYDRTQLINTCFVYVPYFKNLCVCEYFILQEVDVNKKDDRQITALHWASLSNNVEILDLLISHGADLEAKDKSGHTPLLLAT